MEKLQDMVDQKVQMHSRNVKTLQIKNLRRHGNN
jgi:chemotaxis protein CheY-P-specific phosphatase CheC